MLVLTQLEWITESFESPKLDGSKNLGHNGSGCDYPRTEGDCLIARPQATGAKLMLLLRRHQLTKYLSDLEKDGYTLVRDPVADGMAAELRRDTLELAAETSGFRRDRAAALLLGRRDSFTRALTLSVLDSIVEALLGKGAVLSQYRGTVRARGSVCLGMHSDNSYFPEPFPPWEMTCTACWVLDDFSRAGGCTYAIPGSHHERRHPPMELRNDLRSAVPLEAPAGGIWVWTGSLWHGNLPRTLLGERVALHMTFNRLGLQPIEDYRHLDTGWIADQKPVISRLLGRGSLFGSSRMDIGGVDPVLAIKTYLAVHGRDVY